MALSERKGELDDPDIASDDAGPGAIGGVAFVAAMSGVASSNRPEVTSAGTRISPRRSMMSHSLSVPMTWNSLGPFMV